MKYVILDENGDVEVILNKKQLEIAPIEAQPAKGNKAAIAAYPGQALPPGYAEIPDNDPRVAAYNEKHAPRAFVTLNDKGEVTSTFANRQNEPAPKGYAEIAVDDPRIPQFEARQAEIMRAAANPTKEQLMAAMKVLQDQIAALPDDK